METYKKQPLVYVVILTFNGKDDLQECLPTVLAADYPHFKVCLVDNGSTDGSQDMIKKQFPAVSLIENGANLGFAEGNNVGIRHALQNRADYIVTLNQDTEVDPQWLTELVKVAESDTSIAICGAKIYGPDRKTIEYSGTVLLKWNCQGGYTDELDRGQYENVTDAAYACGAALMMKSSLLPELGLFDRDFFMYNEDVDLSMRAWTRGYRTVYVPKAIIYHNRAPTTGMKKRQRYWGMRNCLTTIIKNYQLSTLSEVAKINVRFYLVSRDWVLVKAFLANLLFLPRTLWKRHKIQKKRKLSDREIFSRFKYT